jgi:Tfp pilus assembly protein PilV
MYYHFVFLKACITFVIMKRNSIILITALVVLISVGNFGLFSLFLNQYKTNLQSQIQHNTSSVIDIIHINPSELYANNKNISWEDGNKEIIYKGTLYDIVSIECVKGKVSIKAVSDSKEQDYKMVYANTQEKNNTSSNSPLNLLKQFLSLNFIETKAVTTVPINSSLLTSTYHPYNYIIHKGYQTLETPPPNC